MPVVALNSDDKKELHGLYTRGKYSQVDLASYFMVSRRTIQRALIEMGVLKHNQPVTVNYDQHGMVLEAEKRGIHTREALATVLSKPSLSAQNIRLVMSRLSDRDFENMMQSIEEFRQARREMEAGNARSSA